MQETQVQSLGWEDPQRRKWQPLHFHLSGKIPQTEEPDELHGVTRVRHDVATKPPPPIQDHNQVKLCFRTVSNPKWYLNNQESKKKKIKKGEGEEKLTKPRQII